MDSNEKLQSIAELTSARQMVSVYSKQIFLFLSKLSSYVHAVFFVIAAIVIKQISLTSLAKWLGGDEIADIVSQSPHTWHTFFSNITTFAAILFFLLFVAMIIQGRVFNSLNKSNKHLKQISAIVRK